MLRSIGQLLLAVSMFRLAPFDASILEAKVNPERTLPEPAHLVLAAKRAHLTLAGDKEIPPPKKKDTASFGVVTSADSVIVIDAASGATLYAEEPDNVRPMGSITKLMSAIVFLDTKPNLEKTVMLLEDDYVGGGKMYLQFNDLFSLRAVLGASLVGSDNTATNALARLSGMTNEEFIQKMNEKAVELGMTSTHFVDISGLSADNASTARELAKLLQTAKTYDVIRGYMTKDMYTAVSQSGFTSAIPSTDTLLTSSLNTGDYKITAGKTGYIPQAGYCLATGVQNEGNEVYIVVLGAEKIDDRFTDASALARWSFKTFVWPKL
jgi:D-alanyl-D-alanine endopeptidase (penicillin-binding protein 7)